MRTDDAYLPPLPSPAPFTPDLEKYRALLEGIVGTEEQLNALLLELTAFMVKCVEQQFRLPSIEDIFAVLLSECEEDIAALETLTDREASDDGD